MEQQEFDDAARAIAARNVGDSVKAVTARFEPEQARLVVTYHLHNPPTEEDWDDCDLTCSELQAAFPAIKATESRCVEAPEADESTADLVYLQ